MQVKVEQDEPEAEEVDQTQGEATSNEKTMWVWKDYSVASHLKTGEM